jgi:hypothetical protein
VKPVLLIVCSLAVGLLACKKDKRAPIDQLPPATQSGKKTFGCLVNGQAWLPKGSFPAGSLNPVLLYDPTFKNGTLSIHAYRVGGSNHVDIVIGGTNIDKPGTYPIGTRGTDAEQIANVRDKRSGCNYYNNENGTVCSGRLEITKLSMTEKIIAGTFSFTISTPGCETWKVTDGRFDLRLY